MHIVKLANCTLYINMYSLSALYMLWSVPIVKVILVIFFKKKKKKKDPYFGMVKIPKLCHKKNPAIYLFLGKGRESFISNFIKTKLSALSALPSSTQTFFNSDTVWMMHAKIHAEIEQKIHFFCKFCTFPVTEGYAI